MSRQPSVEEKRAQNTEHRIQTADIEERGTGTEYPRYMSGRDQITTFIDLLARYDGFAPFSDAKLPIDPASHRVVVVAENDGVTAIGVSASHIQTDRSVHKALETATLPAMRFARFEGAVLDAAMPLIDGADSYSIWSSRSSLHVALKERGFVESRTIDFLVVDLPIAGAPAMLAAYPIRTFETTDVAGVTGVNRSAFEGHREAAALDMEEMGRYEDEPWFDADGFFIAESESGGVAGFCWTKVHPNGDGEIFRIAVDPAYQATGLGRALIRAGFTYLAGLVDVRRGALWVDRSNATAVALYQSLGMKRERSNSEFVPG